MVHFCFTYLFCCCDPFAGFVKAMNHKASIVVAPLSLSGVRFHLKKGLVHYNSILFPRHPVVPCKDQCLNPRNISFLKGFRGSFHTDPHPHQVGLEDFGLKALIGS